ncbi:hypothetical protein [Streptococcus uberis]|uniref:hypothetical protein n=1 Tax=Streptococcus uberis TaxID=1349 RepID=UPI00333E9162|nr:hypothetical protein [Streptococcus uberis]
MNNPQRVDRLLRVTRDITKTYEIVATSTDRDLKYLDKFLEEFVDEESLELRPGKPSLIYVKTSYSYSICIVEEKYIRGEKSILLTLVSGMSPMNWGEDFFEKANSEYNFNNLPVFMKLFEDREIDQVLPVK